MSNVHPDVQAALDMARDLRHRIADLRERIHGIRARLPSPNGHALAEVDAMSRLTGLYLLNDATSQLSGAALAEEIMASIREGTADARRQYDNLMAGDDAADLVATDVAADVTAADVAANVTATDDAAVDESQEVR